MTPDSDSSLARVNLQLGWIRDAVTDCRLGKISATAALLQIQSALDDDEDGTLNA